MKDHHEELFQELEELGEYLTRRSNSILKKVRSSDKKELIWEAYNKGLADGYRLAGEWLEGIIEKRNNNG